MIQGRVVRSTGAWYQVKGEDGSYYACQLRGKLRLSASQFTNFVVVGDEVLFKSLKLQATGVIYKIIPRKNYLIRQATCRKSHGQLLAANLDQALLVLAAPDAPTQLDFIDHFLVVAEAFEIPPMIVFNKIDLLNKLQQEALECVKGVYEKLGYETLAISAYDQLCLSSFYQVLLGKVSLLSGHSGVGKSTLVNAISPAANQTVAPTSPFSKSGQHTTTYTALFEVAPNTFIIDTPGIQTLVPYAIEKQSLSHYFPEICSRAPTCKFYNCTHLHEPDCAVIEALEQGEIAASRYKSYSRLADAKHP
ncbi:MAG: ribosome small subunit-dependent GTPase A [Amoebophilaceae bacterium]|jgi:ribosome biogenesis GTPase|nr:ribosome small subunit-dependent GTPase A [Amoebophilaceae bacterium]